MAENRKCAHPGCNCTTSNNSKYCSQTCQAAGDRREETCGCGHASCGAGADAKRTLHA
jgi:hypothetical protein